MEKLSLKNIKEFRAGKRKLLETRLHPEKVTEELHLLVCSGTGCEANKSDKIYKNLESSIIQKGLKDKVSLVKTGCFGFCEQGPIIKVMPDRAFYVRVEPSDVDEIVEQHLVQGNKVE